MVFVTDRQKIIEEERADGLTFRQTDTYTQRHLTFHSRYSRIIFVEFRIVHIWKLDVICDVTHRANT